MTQSAPKKPMVRIGESAPLFHARSPSNPRFSFDTMGGRYLVLCFGASMQQEQTQLAIETLYQRADLFDDEFASFFYISNDPGDESEARISTRAPGYRIFWDFDHKIADLYGLSDQATAEGVMINRQWVVLDPTMRVIMVMNFTTDGQDAQRLLAYLDLLPPPQRFSGIELQAPVLYLPNVFEPALCQHLVKLYHKQGGEESGFMREIDGRTVGLRDPAHKMRKDITLSDPKLIETLQNRIIRRVVPEIKKVHQFNVTRMERYIVSCYAAEDGGHFRAHRDNTTSGTAHRRFAVSINLNDDFEGGEVSFPEYSKKGFKAPIGGAVVFSCSLLHQVSQVTQGARYAFLPFLYDEAAAKIRQQNANLIAEG